MTEALAAGGLAAPPELWSQEHYDAEAPQRRRWVLRLEEVKA